MREILFKARRKYNGQWTEGDLIQVKRDDGTIDCWIAEQTARPINYNVFPETVCQYTGLTDKNGKKIFEGDIAKDCTGTEITISVIKYREDASFGLVNEMRYYGLWLGWVNEQIEVIGNIYDKEVERA